MGKAQFFVSPSVFEELFQLPVGYKIVGIDYEPEQKYLIRFVLESDSLPSGGELLTVALVMHAEHLASCPEYKKLTGEIKLL